MGLWGSPKKMTGCAAIPLATETEGQNRTFGYGKWVHTKPLTIGNVTKLTNFEAILHKIYQIWPKSCHLLRKKSGGIRSKWPKFAENIPLATELHLKSDHWLRKSSQKWILDYGNWPQKGTVAGGKVNALEMSAPHPINVCSHPPSHPFDIWGGFPHPHRPSSPTPSPQEGSY